MNREQFILLLLGIGGFIFQSLLRAKSLNDLSLVSNVHFNFWKDYVLKDIYGILASFMAPFIWFLLFKEAATNYPKFQSFARLSFFGMGATGSYVLQLILGTAKKRLKGIIDIKTDIADNKTSTS